MYLTDGARKNIRTIAGILYSRSLDAEALRTAAPAICAAMGSHYFAFVRFSLNRKGGAILYSNNTPEFLDVYTSVMDKDFILTELIEQQKPVSLRKIPDWNAKIHYDFTIPVQKIRPISDVLYIPAHIGGILTGYYAIGRAGIHSPVYSDNEFNIFEFISALLSEAVNQPIASFPEAEDVALLNGLGEVLCAGERIGASFVEIFGADAWKRPCRAQVPAALAFRESFFRFLRDTGCPWNSRFIWTDKHKRSRNFSFQIQGAFEGCPVKAPLNKTTILVTQGREDYNEEKSVFPFDRFRGDYLFTDRELEILQGIYQGRSNKDIAASLGVSEPTVKRGLSGIYEKTGATSRTRLILKLSL